jgi:LmbE family N-acetylglucosaminyl deacetylase
MKILVIAPHPDDEVLGVGGTVAKHVRMGDEVYLCVVTKAYTPDWSEEYLKNKEKEVPKVNKILGIKKTYFLDFPTVKLDTVPQKELNNRIAECVEKVKPEIIYIPHKGDINIDHRLVFDATIVATRSAPPHLRKILSYETPSETDRAPPFKEIAFTPNVYVDITNTLKVKLKAMSAYKTELKEFPHPRSVGLLSALAKKRGAEAGLKAAEAFMLIREIKR